MLESSGVGAHLAASQEGLSSMKLFVVAVGTSVASITSSEQSTVTRENTLHVRDVHFNSCPW
jgi:hypothetical protein